MDTLINIFSLLGGGAGLGTAVWYAVNLRAKRKAEQARTNQLETEVILQQKNIRHKDGDWAIKAIKDMDEFRQTYANKVNDLTRVVAFLCANKQKEEMFHCKDISCTKRNPPVGQHKDPLPSWVVDIIHNDDEK